MFEWLRKRFSSPRIPTGSDRQSPVPSPTPRGTSAPASDPLPELPDAATVLVRGGVFVDTSAVASDQVPQAQQMPRNDKDDGTVGQLIEQLVDKRSDIRLRAVQELGKRRASARNAIPGLILAAADSNQDIQQAARRSLLEIDACWEQSVEAEAAVPNLVKRLGGRGAAAAGEVLVLLGGKTASYLLEFLREPDADGGRHADAIYILGRIGAAAALAVASIAKALGEGANHVQRVAAVALGSIGKDAAEAVPALCKALGNRDSDVRECAARSLRVFPAAEFEVLPLGRLLGDREENVRHAAADTLQAFGGTAVGPLVALLETRESWRHIEQWTAILDVVDRAMPKDRTGFHGGKEYIVPPTVLYEIQECVWAANQLIQGAAAVLGTLGPAASSAVAVLVSLLREQDRSIRVSAAGALGRIGADAKVAVPALVRAFSDEHDAVRSAAIEALTKIEPGWPLVPEHSDALESLLAQLDQGPNRTKRLEQSLVKIGPAIVSPLAARLTHRSLQVREATCRVLGTIGAGAAPALAALREVANAPQENGQVRTAAEMAVRRISQGITVISEDPNTAARG